MLLDQITEDFHVIHIPRVRIDFTFELNDQLIVVSVEIGIVALPKNGLVFSSDQVGLYSRWAALKCSLRYTDTFIERRNSLLDFLFNHMYIFFKQNRQELADQYFIFEKIAKLTLICRLPKLGLLYSRSQNLETYQIGSKQLLYLL